jgi:predicted nucleic acid-binding protein
MEEEIRLCLDLNIWIGNLISTLKGKKNTTCQVIVEIIQRGYCNLGGVQLIISWGMLNHLGETIKKLNIEKNLNLDESTINSYINSIEKYTELGQKKLTPQLTLGGTKVIALNDNEDAHILETAIAGRAKAIITRNFDDFTLKKNDTKIIIGKEHAIYSTAQHSLHIVQPKLILKWIESEQIPFIY